MTPPKYAAYVCLCLFMPFAAIILIVYIVRFCNKFKMFTLIHKKFTFSV